MVFFGQYNIFYKLLDFFAAYMILHFTACQNLKSFCLMSCFALKKVGLFEPIFLKNAAAALILPLDSTQTIWPAAALKEVKGSGLFFIYTLEQLSYTLSSRKYNCWLGLSTRFGLRYKSPATQLIWQIIKYSGNWPCIIACSSGHFTLLS